MLKSHLEHCQKFSCDYLECRDDKYTALYVSKEEFDKKEDLNLHMKEKHHQIVKSIESKIAEDQNKFTNDSTDDQDKFIAKLAGNEKTKEVLVDNLIGIEKIASNNTNTEQTTSEQSEQSKKIEELEKENFTLKENAIKIMHEKEEIISKVGLLEI